VLEHPEARPKEVRSLSTDSVDPRTLAGDPFAWAGRRIEEAKLGLRERRTEDELVEAIHQEEARRGQPMTRSEQMAFARGFFAPSYRAEISRLAALGVEDGFAEEDEE
jgi:hypothetical protein